MINTPKKIMHLFVLFATVMMMTSCSTLQQLLVDIVTPELTVVGDPYIVNGIPELITSGSVVVRLPMEAKNTNTVGLQLTAVDLDLFLEERQFASGIFEKQVAIDANNFSSFDLDVTIPIVNALWEWQTLTGLASGSPTSVIVDAGVTVEVLGLVEVFARTEIFNEVVNQ